MVKSQNGTLNMVNWGLLKSPDSTIVRLKIAILAIDVVSTLFKMCHKMKIATLSQRLGSENKPDSNISALLPLICRSKCTNTISNEINNVYRVVKKHFAFAFHHWPSIYAQLNFQHCMLTCLNYDQMHLLWNFLFAQRVHLLFFFVLAAKRAKK